MDANIQNNIPSTNQSLEVAVAKLAASTEAFHITTNEKLVDLKSDMKEIKDGTVSRIVALEKEKADRFEVTALQNKVNNNHEARLVRMENINTYVKIMTGLGLLILGMLIFHLTGYHL
jgi:hypothetical protein